MKLSSMASAFGLYSYGKPAPDGQCFERFNTIVTRLFEEFGITPTYVGIEGEGYSGDYKKFGSRSHQKAVKTGFAGINVLSVVANPDGSDEPSYDGFATVSFSFVDSTQEANLCFAVNESFARFASTAYDNAWKSFLDLNAWDFGYGFSDRVEKQPDFHILGLDNGKLTTVELSALHAWYGSLPDERLGRLRSIYPYNFVSTRQLAKEVMKGLSLRRFIEHQHHGVLTSLTDYGLHLWRLDESAIDHVRAQLDDGAALISA